MKYCSHCGTEVDDNAQICLNCGCMVDASPVLAAKTNLNACSLIGFILSTASIVLSYFGMPITLAGIIVSIVGLVQTNRKGERGKSFAIAGICIGAVLLLIYLNIWLFFVWIGNVITRNGGL